MIRSSSAGTSEFKRAGESGVLLRIPSNSTADVGMVEGGRGAGFTLEAFERLAIARKLLGQKLQGDAAAEARVFGLVHHAHAAAPELLEDAIVGDGLADHGGSPMRRRRSWYRGSERRLSNRGSTLNS